MILADKHEPASMRKACDGVYDLKRMKGNGDYLIRVETEDGRKEVLVERKTAADFVHTIYQEGRLNDQLQGIDVLVFEKFFVPKMAPGWWVRLHTYLNGVSAHTPVFYTLSSKHTIQQLRIVERKLADGTWGAMRQAVVLPPLTSKENECQVRVLMGFPGMGEFRANAILKHYGSLGEALRQVDNWHSDVEGVGPVTVQRARETMDKKIYQGEQSQNP